MHVAGVNASPRISGNTGTLVRAVLAGARAAGAETTLFEMGVLRPGPCRACMACKAGAGCACRDGMRDFYTAAPGLDALVIGTPIYFDHVSGQCKVFIDRLFAYLHPGLENHYPGGRRAVLCISYGDDGPGAYDPVLDWMEERLRYYFGFTVTARLKRHACAGEVTTAGDADLLRRAQAAGRAPAE
ncbi:MAG: flavodoxin family protein [Planctomycetota bacterium]